VRKRLHRNSGQRGSAVIEVALLAPGIFFLFAGIMDVGFYNYALISTQNAARTAVEYTSRSASTAADSTGACAFALDHLNGMSNVRSLTTCSASPLVVTATAVTDADGYAAASVSVTYTTNMLVPVPGVKGQMSMTRTVQMMLR
jgi:Flp pilus assembly protein TadG